jgi:NNP family nitrate/nitrite transporter-like MFS transporter
MSATTLKNATPLAGAEEPGGKRWHMLALCTLAFTVCFAAWMLNGVLVTFLVDNGVFAWSPSEMGWLIGIPVLTGSIFRLPLGLATDRWGGRLVFSALMLASAVPMFLVSLCVGYWTFLLASLGFGMVGTSFAVGIAYTSLWFPKHQQGTALGIFGAGNAGAALTTMGAPHLLNWFTSGRENLENWRFLPRVYAVLLASMGILFLLATKTRLPAGARRTLLQQLTPLGSVRVWRFGLYYFFVFGGFVALAQWLVPYYVNAYAMSIAMAGTLAACNSLPSGLIRAIGGWMSDRWGARTVMYWVLGLSLVSSALLIVPQMEIRAPGSGIMARAAGTVEQVEAARIVVRSRLGQQQDYALKQRAGEPRGSQNSQEILVLPTVQTWHEAVVQPGQEVAKRALLARGVTQIFFQANVWIFTFLSFLLGAVMGVGKAAVYKHIPDYFPNDVGVVGGIVGVLGGLGGFICPVIFGYLLEKTGLWTSCWMFFLVLVAICLSWMHLVIRRMMREQAPELVKRFEAGQPA